MLGVPRCPRPTSSGIVVPREKIVRKAFMVIAAVAAGTACAAGAAPVKDGRQVYESTCISCHGTGRDGAPRVGDAGAWKKRADGGLEKLSASALEGVRKMPPHGGRLDLSDVEIQRAIAFMVNNSGGHWTEPTDRRTKAAARSGEQIVHAQCVKCHGTGVGGAPRLDDRQAWIQRARLGFDGLVASAIHGHGGMPARGGMADLTDDEMRSAVAYMFQKSGKKP
jgi:cytochrome c5